jgi:hypothetical protein
MTFNFHCQNCREDLEFDYDTLADSPKGIKCESCGKRLSPADLEEFVSALDELLAQVAGLRKRFLVSFDVDADDLPTTGSGDDDEEESEDEDDDEVDDDEVEDDAGDEDDY